MIVKVVDAKHLQELRNDAANLMIVSLSVILEHLFDSFGNIDSPTFFHAKENKKIFWNISDLPVII